MTESEINDLEEWLQQNTSAIWHVQIRPTKRAETTGIISVVVYLDDPVLWPMFLLTWC